MSELMFASIAVALLSLIFSSVPFVQLVYIFGAQYVATLDDWLNITVLMLITTLGATVYRKMSK